MSWWCSSCSFCCWCWCWSQCCCCCWYVVVDVEVNVVVVVVVLVLVLFLFLFVRSPYLFSIFFSVLFDKRQKKKKNCMCEATWATKKKIPIVGGISRKKSLQIINLPEISKEMARVYRKTFRKLIAAAGNSDRWIGMVLGWFWHTSGEKDRHTSAREMHLRSRLLLVNIWQRIWQFWPRLAENRWCDWTKSCTSWYVEYLIIYSVPYMLGGAGFLPATVCSLENLSTYSDSMIAWWFAFVGETGETDPKVISDKVISDSKIHRQYSPPTDHWLRSKGNKS